MSDMKPSWVSVVNYRIDQTVPCGRGTLWKPIESAIYDTEDEAVLAMNALKPGPPRQLRVVKVTQEVVADRDTGAER